MGREFLIFRGKKFYYPYKCLCCGKIISKEQFCFGTLCGYCDLGRCCRGIGKNCLRYEEGHGRKDIFENAEEMGDELQEMMKEKIEQIEEKKNETKNN